MKGRIIVTFSNIGKPKEKEIFNKLDQFLQDLQKGSSRKQIKEAVYYEYDAMSSKELELGYDFISTMPNTIKIFLPEKYFDGLEKVFIASSEHPSKEIEMTYQGNEFSGTKNVPKEIDDSYLDRCPHSPEYKEFEEFENTAKTILKNEEENKHAKMIGQSILINNKERNLIPDEPAAPKTLWQKIKGFFKKDKEEEKERLFVPDILP